MDNNGRISALSEIAVKHPDAAKREWARQTMYKLRGEDAPPRQDMGGSAPMMRTPGGNVPDEVEPPEIPWKDRALAETTLVTDPRKRRQALSTVDDVAAWGLGKKVANAFGTSDFSPEQQARDQAEAPLSRMEHAGIGLGTLLLGGAKGGVKGGLTGIAAKGVEGAVRRLPGMATVARAAPTVAGMAVGAGSAYGGNVAMQAGQGLVDQGPGEALRRGADAAKDPVPAVAGSILGGFFGAGTAMREGNPNVRRIEDLGGRVGTTTPGAGKPFEDPLVAQGIDKATGRVTEFGRGKVARAAARGADDTLSTHVQGLDENMRQAKDAARSAGTLDQPVDVTNEVRQVFSKANDPWLPGSVRNTIQRDIIDDLFGGKNPFPEGEGMARAPQITMTVDNANRLRKKLFDLADVVNPKATDPDIKSLGGQMKGVVDASPMGQINAPYREGAEKVQNARQALEYPRFKDIHAPLVTPADEMKVSNVLSRRGQDTARAGMQDTPEMQQALRDFPELQRYGNAVPLLDSRSALELKGLGSLPTGGLYLKNLPKMLGQNVDAAKARLVAPALIGAGRQAPLSGPLLRFLGRDREGRQ